MSVLQLFFDSTITGKCPKTGLIWQIIPGLGYLRASSLAKFVIRILSSLYVFLVSLLFVKLLQKSFFYFHYLYYLQLFDKTNLTNSQDLERRQLGLGYSSTKLGSQGAINM